MTKTTPATQPIETYINQQTLPGIGDVQGETPSAIPSHDQLYEVGYQLALQDLGYKGMQSKIFADAFVGEYQRALENGLSDVLAIRFGAEFAGPFAIAFMHYLNVTEARSEDEDIYGGARAFAQMSFDIYEEQFAQEFGPIHRAQMEKQTLQEMISQALQDDVTTENLGTALQAHNVKVYKKAHEDGLKQGLVQGRAEGKAEGIIEGKELGRQAGYEAGKADGIVEGKTIGLQEGYSQGFKKGEDVSMIHNTGSSAQDFLQRGDDLLLEDAPSPKKKGFFSK